MELDRNECFSAKAAEVRSRYPWYDSLLRQHAAEASPLTPERFPLLTSDVLERFYYSQPPADESSLSVYYTSGTSTGKRKAIYYSAQDDDRYIEIKTMLFGKWLRGEPTRKAMADLGTGHAASTALDVFRQLGLECVSISFEQPIEEHIERLEAFRPDLLYTMPSILEQIANASADPSQYGIKKIILVGEIASSEWQRKYAAAFGIRPHDMLDTYGSMEIGTIASYSHELGKYVLAPGLYAEGIKPESLQEKIEPLLPNERILVLTSFVRTSFPALRYVTYDVVRDLETVVIDGVPRQCFACISKRVGSELKHGEKISLYDIEEAIYGYVETAEVKVQFSDNRLTVLIYGKSLNEAIIPSIQKAIERKIPEIGQMIRNRLIQSIEVRAVQDRESLVRAKIKKKKFYY